MPVNQWLGVVRIMNIIDKSKDLSSWLNDKVDGLQIHGDEKTRVVAGCFDIVLEHQQACTILAENKLYGSAFALARSVFEAYIRGIWLRECATDDQVQSFLKDDFRINFQAMIDDIEQIEEYATGVLAKAKKAGWPLLNSLTHTGFNQVIRRNTDDSIEPNYSEQDIETIINFVNSTALLAGLETTKLAKTKIELVQLEFIDKMKEYVGNDP